jgi:hypothetical protein
MRYNMKPKTKTIMFILMSFVLGIFCGWFLEDRILIRKPFPKGREHGEFIKILNKSLHLSELQTAQVDSILESRRQKMDVFRKQAIAMRDTTRIEIRKILNEEQSKIFDEFNQKKDQEEARMWEQEAQKKR